MTDRTTISARQAVIQRDAGSAWPDARDGIGIDSTVRVDWLAGAAGITAGQPHAPPSMPALISGFGGSPPSQIARNALAKSSPLMVPFTAPFTST